MTRKMILMAAVAFALVAGFDGCASTRETRAAGRHKRLAQREALRGVTPPAPLTPAQQAEQRELLRRMIYAENHMTPQERAARAQSQAAWAQQQIVSNQQTMIANQEKALQQQQQQFQQQQLQQQLNEPVHTWHPSNYSGTIDANGNVDLYGYGGY
jgi:hypothetical protein